MKCTFCGEEMRRGTGKIYVKKTGEMYNLCSSKCEQNLLKLKRKPREIKWTRESRKVRGKE